MPDFLPNWAMTIYSKLWVNLGTEKFSRKDAESAVKDKNLSQAFSKLKKHGWLRIELDPEGGRKSLYTLNDPNEVIGQLRKGK